MASDSGSIAWNAYIDEFGHEPASYNQLQSFSKTRSDLQNLNFKTARDTFNNNTGKGRIGGHAGNALAVPGGQEMLPSDTENEEEYEYYEEVYYEEEPEAAPKKAPKKPASGYKKARPPPPRAPAKKKKVSNAKKVKVMDASPSIHSMAPPPQKMSSKLRLRSYTAENEDGEEQTDIKAPDHEDGDEQAVWKQPSEIISTYTVPSKARNNEDDEERVFPCLPFGYSCILWTALAISILALLLAAIPLLAFIGNLDELIEISEGTGSDGMGSSGNGYGRSGLQKVWKIIYHINNVDATRPTYEYEYAPPELDATSYGDFSDNRTIYVGGWRGWEYVGGWDFSYDPAGSWCNIDGADCRDNFRKYPFEDVRVHYGDRLVWRNADWWARSDDLWLVPKEVFDSCNYTVGGYNDEYPYNGTNFFLDDDGDVIENSTFRLFAGGDVYTNRSDVALNATHLRWPADPKLENITWDDFEQWTQFVWNIEDNSHLLPCDEDDLWCQLITDDTLYFVSMYRWDVSWSSGYRGNCRGQWSQYGGAGMKQKVIIDGYHKNLPTVKADVNALLDPEVVDTLQYAIGTLGRTMILSQFSDEQRIRSEGHSGLTNVRGHYDGDAYYDDGTYTNGAVASIHDHADNIIVVGIGEIQAVLNGVEFQTRHNDYNLNMPHRNSTEYGATEPIPYPDVPPEVLNAGSVDNQIAEMQEWFRAFKTQNKSHRNYTNYFKPILCYLEGNWVLDDDQLEEPFDSDRHVIDAKSWKELHDKIRWMANSGRKNSLENLAHLPSSVRNLLNETFPIVSNWEYRILCHPLKNDVPTSRFQIVDDLSVQLMGSPLTRDELEYSRRARFQINTYINTDDPDDHRWSAGRTRWNYLDYLMEQIPGKDNYIANISDALPDGSEEVIHYETDEVINSGYYSRFYGLLGEDAMGSSKHRRGWADRFLWAAKTTQEKVSPIEFDFEMDGTDEWGNEQTVYYPTISRWSYAIPLEIIFQTPLSNWNPYGIEYIDRSRFDYSRSGECARSTAFRGWTTDNAFFTPEEFFNGITTTSSADTADGAVCALGSDDQPKSVMASGHWITFPEIANNVGYVRQRYPIFPIHDDGYPSWKEVKALEDIVLSDDYDDITNGLDFFGDERDLTYGFTVYLQGGGHQHEMYIPGWKVYWYWYDYNNLVYRNGSSYTIEVDAETRNGHAHTVSIWRWRTDEMSAWNYEIETCRYGSISDEEFYSAGDYMTGRCADLHSSITR